MSKKPIYDSHLQTLITRNQFVVEIGIHWFKTNLAAWLRKIFGDNIINEHSCETQMNYRITWPQSFALGSACCLLYYCNVKMCYLESYYFDNFQIEAKTSLIIWTIVPPAFGIKMMAYARNLHTKHKTATPQAYRVFCFLFVCLFVFE